MKKIMGLGIIFMLLIINLLNVSASVVEDECIKVDIAPGDGDDSDNSDDEYTKFNYVNKYAVIIVGGYGDGAMNPRSKYHKWYSNDAGKYHKYLESKDFSKENIKLLFTKIDGYECGSNYDSYMYDMDGTRANIESTFNSLKSKITSNDLLFVLVIDHGNTKNGHTFFTIEPDSEKIYDYELAGWTSGINARRIIYVMQPCKSGGFIKELSRSNSVVLTASTQHQLACAPYLSKLHGGLQSGGSLADAYEVAAMEVYQWIQDNGIKQNGWTFQFPLLDDNGDGIGHKYLGFGYDKDDQTKDGYIANRIFDLTYEYSGLGDSGSSPDVDDDDIYVNLNTIYTLPTGGDEHPDHPNGPIPMAPITRTGSSDENKKPVFTNEITLDAIADQDLTIKPYICHKQNIFDETELLIADEYNIDSTIYLKWRPENRIITQSFVPDCSSIGAFGASVGFTGKTAPGDDTPIPDVKISLFRDFHGVADVDNPLTSRIFTKEECKDDWIGVGYDVDDFVPLGLDGFVHLEDMSMSPIEISVTPGETYYVGVEVLGPYPDNFCGGYTWGQTDDLYQSGRRRDLENVNGDWQWVRENKPYTIYKDMTFSVWGWDMLPEMPSDPKPSGGETVEITKSILETDGTLEEDTGSIDGHAEGVFLEFCTVDRDSNSRAKGLFYVDSNDDDDFTKAGTSLVSNGKARLFFTDLDKESESQVKWKATVEDWGIIRATHEIWKFTTNPYAEDTDARLEEREKSG